MTNQPSGRDPRVAEAERLLVRYGIAAGQVSVCGPENEIAAIALPAADLRQLLDDAADPLVAELHGLGFRYVALDLAPLDTEP